MHCNTQRDELTEVLKRMGITQLNRCKAEVQPWLKVVVAWALQYQNMLLSCYVLQVLGTGLARLSARLLHIRETSKADSCPLRSAHCKCVAAVQLHSANALSQVLRDCAVQAFTNEQSC